MSTYSKPSIHLAGSAATELIEQYGNAYQAVHQALVALRQVEPNGRDYPARPGQTAEGRYSQAKMEHVDRLQALEKVLKDLSEIQSHLIDHLPA